MPELSTIQQICIWILPMLFAITIHEAAHAWVAASCGDTTAKALGRLSFNPIKHIDLFGTILVPLLILVLSQFHFAFGWAKPVPINERLFKNPRRDIVKVAAAGPAVNILMAILWAAIAKIALNFNPALSMAALFFFLTAQAGIVINLVLGFLNLIPIPPLDGGRIATAWLPVRWGRRLERVEPYGFFILLALMFSGGLAFLLNPLINGSIRLLQQLFNL